MRLGLIARAEDRGLGIQTWEVYRHLHPDRTLVIEPGTLGRGFTVHRERYPDGRVVEWGGGALDERHVRSFIDGLDVIYTAETFYDWRIVEWARESGVRTVLHANPEFFCLDDRPTPDRVWLPTCWRQDYIEEHCDAPVGVMPMPVDTDRIRMHRGRQQTRRFLHVAGHAAARDRNGTDLVLQALPLLPRDVTVKIVTQDRRLPGLHQYLRRAANLTVVSGGVADYWRLYDDVDAVILPRRYGGLCLPAQEAMAAGLPVAMPTCSPNLDAWPVFPMSAIASDRPMRTAGGKLLLHDTPPGAIADAITALCDQDQLATWSAESMLWAQQNSWEVRAPLWFDALAEVAA